MKYALKSSLILLLAVPLIAAWVPIGGKGNAVNLTLSESTVSGLTVKVTVPGIEHNTVQTKGGEFESISIPNEGVTSELGKPKLPAIRRFFEVPLGANPRLEIIKKDVKTFSLSEWGITLQILPVEPSVPKIRGGYEMTPFVYDEETYTQDAFYPETPVRIFEAGIVRGHRLFVLEVIPTRYNPVKSEVEVLRSIEVRISFDGGNASLTRSKLENKAVVPFDESLRDRIINYGVFEPEVTPGNPMGYLIITPSLYVSTLSSFVDWKTLQGYHVTVATTEDIGNTTTAIKNYIQNAYHTWEIPPTFVLLVGDVNQIPNWTGSGNYNPATDLYYGTLEGSDDFPDVYVSRISVTSTSQLSGVLDKILSYEQNDWSNGYTWAGKAFFIASADPSNHGVAEGTHNYCISIVRSHGMLADSFYAYYQSGAPAAITNAINNGRSWVTYSGHGGETGWADYGDLQYSNTDVYNLSNLDKYPLVQSYACLTGKYTESECFMEAWLRAPGKGAAASFGSSVYSYWDEDDILQRRLFDEAFDSGYVWVMGMVNEGKYDLWLHYGGGGLSHSYYEQYNLFGEPSMDIFSLAPETLYVTYPATIPVGPSDVNVTVSSPSGAVREALVSIVMNGEILGTAWTNGSGQATISVNPTTTGTATITVTAHNKRVFQGNIVVSSAGPYIAYLSSTINDFSGNGDGMVNPGETVDLTVTAKNFGQEATYGVYGILSEDDPYANISIDSSYFGDFAPDETHDGTPPYRFQVSESCPKDHEILFTLTFHDQYDSTWVSNFTIHVYRFPDISVTPTSLSMTLPPDDSASTTMTISNSGQDTLIFEIFDVEEEVVVRGIKVKTHHSQKKEVYQSVPDNAPKGYREPHGKAQIFGTGGPDEYGYIWIDSDEPGGPDFNWVEISGVGTPLYLSDDGYATVSLPWTFNFYGFNKTSMKISANGYLTFGADGSDYTNDPIPNSQDPNDLIAPFWDDLNPSAGGQIYYYNDDANNRFIVEWQNVPHFYDEGSYTFEAILYPNGDILYQYYNMSGDLTSATVGIENSSGTIGLQVVYNASYVHNNLATLITASYGWLDEEPDEGTVLPGDAQDITVTFNSSDMAPGVYYATIYVVSNDPDEDTLEIPVTFHVGTYVLGDVNADGNVDINDLLYLANYIFQGGPPPNPMESGDTNLDGNVDLGDLNCLANYLFNGGPLPCGQTLTPAENHSRPLSHPLKKSGKRNNLR